MLPAAQIVASDIDPVAVEVAEANVAINRLAGRITCVVAAGFDDARIVSTGPFDLVFANILKGPLIELAPAMAENVDSGGLLILSGLLVVQVPAIISAYEAENFLLQDREDIGEWSALVLRKT
jgi:ribosomal protein L11 methyltransferase